MLNLDARYAIPPAACVQRSTPRGPGASQRLLEGSLSGLSAEQQRDLVEYLKSH